MNMKFIKQIEIRQFRSIELIKSFETESLNIFVGNNDNGKSNILRALNLFFNNQTDINEKFKFHQDFSYHVSDDVKNKEVKIELIISPPIDRFKDSNLIRWTKKWKPDGSMQEERALAENNEKLNPTSNVFKWLDKLKFRYIPAIKSEKYFQNLMEELYDVMNLKFEKQIQSKGTLFIDGLQEITQEITEALNISLGIPNTLQIPLDFKQLFSKLDFGIVRENKIYHLSQRGDGIKVRHIPIILFHMAKEEQSLNQKGYVKPDTIWGFEEPENNLELKYCFELAEKFIRYAEPLQIFITTHSPAFYQLNSEKGVKTFYVMKKEHKTSITKLDDSIDINNEMGLLPLISPYIEEIYNKEKYINNLKEEILSLKEQVKFVVLTEDCNTKYLEKLLEFHGIKSNELEILSYGGSSQLKTSGFSLAKYISSKKSVKIIIHRDRDYLSNEEINGLKEAILSRDYFPLITDGVDIESIFVCKDHLYYLYNNSLSLDEVENYISEAIEEAKDDSLQRLIDQSCKDNLKPSDGTYKFIKELENNYFNNPKRYFYGKKVFGLLKSKFQKHLKLTPNFIQNSPYIIQEELIKFINNYNQFNENRINQVVSESVLDSSLIKSKNNTFKSALLNYKNRNNS